MNGYSVMRTAQDYPCASDSKKQQVISMEYFAFQWHVTDNCDQHCKHCYYRDCNKPESPCNHREYRSQLQYFDCRNKQHHFVRIYAVDLRLPYSPAKEVFPSNKKRHALRKVVVTSVDRADKIFLHVGCLQKHSFQTLRK